MNFDKRLFSSTGLLMDWKLQTDIIRNRYGDVFVREIRKFEKNESRFLLECKKSNLIRKFLQFKLANRHLHNSLAYKKCQIKLLEKEIRAKRKSWLPCAPSRLCALLIIDTCLRALPIINTRLRAFVLTYKRLTYLFCLVLFQL